MCSTTGGGAGITACNLSSSLSSHPSLFSFIFSLILSLSVSLCPLYCVWTLFVNVCECGVVVVSLCGAVSVVWCVVVMVVVVVCVGCVCVFGAGERRRGGKEGSHPSFTVFQVSTCVFSHFRHIHTTLYTHMR